MDTHAVDATFRIRKIQMGGTRPRNYRFTYEVIDGSDRGFVTLGARHLLPAPAVLAMIALHDEISDPS
jgi:hypothetical protein